MDKMPICWDYNFLFSKQFISFLDLIPEAAILSNETGEVIIANSTAQKLFGLSKERFLKAVIEDFVPENIRKFHTKLRKSFFKDPKPRYMEGRNLELLACKSDGSYFPMESALFAIHTDRGLIAVNLIRDVSEKNKENRKITEYAFVDTLTNLANRRYFDKTIAKNLIRASKHKQMFALLYIDLDNFKPINDERGHTVGDKVLKIVAKRLSSSIRDVDFLARVGGDEFAIMLYPYTNEALLTKLANRVIRACQKPIKIDGVVINISASIGICITDGHDSAENIISCADNAMYKAKEKGGSTYMITCMKK